jgi:hypothetical protein
MAAVSDFLRASVRGYVNTPHGHGPQWVDQFDKYWNDTRVDLPNREKLINLLELVSGSGWNMNRNRRCDDVIKKIRDGRISEPDITKLFDLLDSLLGFELRKLHQMSTGEATVLCRNIQNIREHIASWNQSMRTICFLTKPILMFNWGETPALDSRVRSCIGVSNDLATDKYVAILQKVSRGLLDIERQVGLLENIVKDELGRYGLRVRDLPIGRAVDMVCFGGIQCLTML